MKSRSQLPNFLYMTNLHPFTRTKSLMTA